MEGVSVFGNTVFADGLLLEKIDIRSGDPFKRMKIRDATLAILTLYADNGYLDAEVNPDIRIDSEAHRVLIDFFIREETQYTIAQIHLKGLQKTRPRVVRRELLFSPRGGGSILSPSGIATSAIFDWVIPKRVRSSPARC